MFGAGITYMNMNMAINCNLKIGRHNKVFMFMFKCSLLT
jgi:hypothetical protein